MKIATSRMSIRTLSPACRLFSTAAARKRGDIDGHGLTSARNTWQKGKRNVLPPTKWDPSLVDRVVSTTAADVMSRPCVVSPKPDEMVHYVQDTDSVQQSADVFWKKRIGGELVALGPCLHLSENSPAPLRELTLACTCALLAALLVKSASDGSLVGILSERDFVKALATDTTKTSVVGDLMTPLSKMITVSVTTGVGECMELMRKHGIRHLPVMATHTGEDKNHAVQNLHKVAQRAEATARKQVQQQHPRGAHTTGLHLAPSSTGHVLPKRAIAALEALMLRARMHLPVVCSPCMQLSAFETKLRDAFGDNEGRQMFENLAANPDIFMNDDRPLLQRASAAAAKLRLAKERLHSVSKQAETFQASHPVGIISIRDLLLTMTANQVVPLLDWLNEERRTLIEERVGYSE